MRFNKESQQNRLQKALNDNWFKPFLLSGFFMFISSFYQFFILKNSFFPLWDKGLSFLGLFNWIPFFIFFYSFQKFLITEKERFRSSIFLVSGTIPLLVSALGQYFFNWHDQSNWIWVKS